MTFEDFIEKAHKVHGDKYDYGNVDFKGGSVKVNIKCEKHGYFEQTPYNHINGRGCPKCHGYGFTSEERIKMVSELHEGKYDYSLSDFSTSKHKTEVICKEHGVFLIDFDHHYNGKNGCPKCCGKKKLTQEEFSLKATLKHGGFYKYNEDYKSSHEKISIECPIHGIFRQTPNAHLNGQGCPKCKSKSKLEEELEKALIDNNIEYQKQVNGKTLHYLGYQSIDFYIPSKKIAIECQGKQHFGEGGWSNSFDFTKQYELDLKKYNLCNENGIKVVYFSKITPKNGYFGEIYTNKDKIINIIKENK